MSRIIYRSAGGRVIFRLPSSWAGWAGVAVSILFIVDLTKYGHPDWSILCAALLYEVLDRLPESTQ